MKERPILFSAPMVRALLDGSKTQTRRVVKPQPSGSSLDDPLDGKWLGKTFDGLILPKIRDLPIETPYGQPGDRLWVRESWRIGAWCEDNGLLAIDYLASEPEKTPWIKVPEDAENFHGGSVFEKYWVQSTDDAIESDLSTDINGRYHWEPGQSPCRKRPSIHMPRWASRITLEITRVRVERLQEISGDDAKAEGVDIPKTMSVLDNDTKGRPHSAYRHCYKLLWESINGPGSWDLNPWVWVVEFTRHNAK